MFIRIISVCVNYYVIIFIRGSKYFIKYSLYNCFMFNKAMRKVYSNEIYIFLMINRYNRAVISKLKLP